MARALNIPYIPFDVSIIDSETWSWTDYQLEIILKLTPESLEKLLQGRKFEKHEPSLMKYRSDTGKLELVPQNSESYLDGKYEGYDKFSISNCFSEEHIENTKVRILLCTNGTFTRGIFKYNLGS